jgi:hypothetical protein
VLLIFIVGDILGGGIYALVGEVGGEVGGAIWTRVPARARARRLHRRGLCRARDQVPARRRAAH